MTREVLHKRIDEALNDLGFQNEVTMKWGSFTLQVNFEKGLEVITIRERETKK